jgi:hypothetical protein
VGEVGPGEQHPRQHLRRDPDNHQDIDLDRNGDEFTATGTSEVRDASGNVTLTGCNTLAGTRMD